MKTNIARRTALRRIGGTALAGGTIAALAERISAAEAGLKGQVNHSVCRWCYNKIEIDDLCKASKEMGIQSVELLKVEEFPAVKKYGLACAMVSGVPGGIEVGLNRTENHAKIAEWMEKTIPVVATAGYPNVICFSGNRKGMSDEQGIENCAIGIKQFIAVAEKHKINVVMELLNSKVNHKDYMCDHTAWGVELCKRVGSDRFKLLYDIYHMQIMEGDLIATIKSSHQYIAHYHTGGVPGRNEIDDTQEIHYPAVMKAILATGFKGFVAQEFIPKRPDALASLKQGVQICDV
jgi:hydroxypyruvate isomerase